jgi:DnaJ-class molecular chaperone
VESGKVQLRVQAGVLRREYISAARLNGWAADATTKAGERARAAELAAEEVQAEKQEDCPTCNGLGKLARQDRTDTSPCVDCDGEGHFYRCGKCDGWGWAEPGAQMDDYTREACDRCKGNGVMASNGRPVKL